MSQYVRIWLIAPPCACTLAHAPWWRLPTPPPPQLPCGLGLWNGNDGIPTLLGLLSTRVVYPRLDLINIDEF